MEKFANYLREQLQSEEEVKAYVNAHRILLFLYNHY